MLMISAYAEIYENILIMDEAFTKFYSLMWGEFYVIKRPCHLSTMRYYLLIAIIILWTFILLFFYFMLYIFFWKKKEGRNLIKS